MPDEKVQAFVPLVSKTTGKSNSATCLTPRDSEDQTSSSSSQLDYISYLIPPNSLRYTSVSSSSASDRETKDELVRQKAHWLFRELNSVD